MKQIQAKILSNRQLQGDYFQLDMCAPEIAQEALPGQFVHVQIPDLEHRVLRRPFSIYDTDPATGRLSLVYKTVGEGTRKLCTNPSDGTLNVIGPNGKGFTSPADGQKAILVAGGFGCAATFLLAKLAPVKPIVLIGGRSKIDILLQKEYTALGCDLRISTDDGSLGHHGLVTNLLHEALAEFPNATIAACGPNPMLKAVAAIAPTAEISLDQPMCCGVGACFACVVKLKADTPDGWRYARSCMEGPVFNATQVWWD